MSKPAVLFLCTGNSARSQMAEGLLRRYGGDRYGVRSAGLEPQPVNPYACAVMDEIGIDISDQRSKSLFEYDMTIPIEYLITVCGDAENNCPTLPGVAHRLHWPFEDPARFRGPEAETLAKFQEVRDQIEQRIKAWLAEEDINLAT